MAHLWPAHLDQVGQGSLLQSYGAAPWTSSKAGLPSLHPGHAGEWADAPRETRSVSAHIRVPVSRTETTPRQFPLQCRPRRAVLSHRAATQHMGLVRTWNVATDNPDVRLEIHADSEGFV